MRIPRRWTGSFEFACYTASCRPPGSGGTGGSAGRGMSALAFGRISFAQSGGGDRDPHNAWLNADGSVTPVEHHEDGVNGRNGVRDGYTQATLRGKVRIISMPHRGELTVDASLMNHGLTQHQVDAARIIFAQTKAVVLYVSGPRSVYETKKLKIATRDVNGALKELNDAFEDE